MIGSTTTPTAQRREAKVASIVATAWELARTQGIGGLSLHALARELGIRQPSLYAYFDSKLALYDAMFADGNRQLLERLDARKLPREPRAAVKAFMRAFVEFAVEDEARCTLLFQRPIPGFEPSSESYEYAQAVLARAVGVLNAAGVERQGDVDCFVAMVAGLIDAQVSNEPRGDRWTRHLNRLTDLYLDDIEQRSTRS
jgi:AcrR family transcriptional regulator